MYIEAKCQMENEDVVGAAPTGDASTTSEWPTIELPTKVRLILETWRYYMIGWSGMVLYEILVCYVGALLYDTIGDTNVIWYEIIVGCMKW